MPDGPGMGEHAPGSHGVPLPVLKRRERTFSYRSPGIDRDRVRIPSARAGIAGRLQNVVDRIKIPELTPPQIQQAETETDEEIKNLAEGTEPEEPATGDSLDAVSTPDTQVTEKTAVDSELPEIAEPKPPVSVVPKTAEPKPPFVGDVPTFGSEPRPAPVPEVSDSEATTDTEPVATEDTEPITTVEPTIPPVVEPAPTTEEPIITETPPASEPEPSEPTSVPTESPVKTENPAITELQNLVKTQQEQIKKLTDQNQELGKALEEVIKYLQEKDPKKHPLLEKILQALVLAGLIVGTASVDGAQKGMNNSQPNG